MPKTIEAVYENGVFKPVSSVEVKEHSIVRLIIEEAASIARATSGIIPAKSSKSIDQIALDTEFLPEEA
ncbi:MAG: antitoxin family protein [Thermodesulfovibrionales bacterium]